MFKLKCILLLSIWVMVVVHCKRQRQPKQEESTNDYSFASDLFFKESRKYRRDTSTPIETPLPFNDRCNPLEYENGMNESFHMKSEVDNILWIGGFLPLYDADLRPNSQSGLMMYEALRYAIAKINNAAILPGRMKFALRNIFSTSTTVGIEQRLRNYFHYCFVSNVLFCVGPGTQYESNDLDRLTETFHLPLLGLSSTSEVTETAKYEQIKTYEIFVPSVDFSYQIGPPDYFRDIALRDTILALNWNYIAILTSFDSIDVARVFTQMVLEKAICIGKILSLSIPDKQDAENSDIVEALTALDSNVRIKVLVLFTGQHDSRRVLATLFTMNLQERFYLIFALGTMNFVEVVKDYESVTLGALSIRLADKENDEFRDYFMSLNPETEKTIYFHQYWEYVFECRLESKLLNNSSFPRVNYARKCDGTERFTPKKGYYADTAVSNVINSVRLAAYSVVQLNIKFEKSCTSTNSTQSPDCPLSVITSYRREFNKILYSNSKFGRQLLDPLDASLATTVKYEIINYQNLENGFANVKVGEWTIENPKYMKPEETVNRYKPAFNFSMEKIFWRNSVVGVIPTGNCSEKCPLGNIQENEYHSDTVQCCWHCRECPKNHVVNNNTCAACNFDETADLTNDICVPLPIKYIEVPGNAVAVVIISLSICGLVCVMFIVVFYIKHNDKHVVRASGRDLSYSILAGTALLFACPLLFMRRPGPSLCVLRKTLPSLSLLICFAALFMKNLRLFRIFIMSKTKLRVARPQLISPVSQIIIMSGIAVFQFSLSGMWFVTDKPKMEKILSENGRFVTLQCVNDEIRGIFFINCALGISFMVSCSMLAWKTRNLPKNYNESKYIGFTAYLTTAVFFVFLILYIVTPRSDNYLHEFSICFVCNFIGYIFIVCLFASRVRILIEGRPFEECHDSLRSRARSLTPKSPQKECNMNEFL